VIVDVDGLFPHVTPELLDEFARHPRPSEVGGEPVVKRCMKKPRSSIPVSLSLHLEIYH
jgi:hypothetical protein